MQLRTLSREECLSNFWRQKIIELYNLVKNTYIELVEPTNPEDGLGKFLKRGGGMHHICYEVEDLDAVYEELKKKNEAIQVVVPGFDNEPSTEVKRIFMDGDSIFLYTARKGKFTTFFTHFFEYDTKI